LPANRPRQLCMEEISLIFSSYSCCTFFATLLSAMASTLNNWVSDNLVDILGYTDKTLVDYVLAIAKKSPNDPKKFLEHLSKCDVPITSTTERFADELLRRIPNSGASAIKAAVIAEEKKKIDFLKKNQSYTLLLDDEEPTEKVKAAKSDQGKEHKDKSSVEGKKRKQIRTKKAISSAPDEEEEEPPDKRPKSEEDAEAKYEQDKKEVKEFSDRLKERDKQKVKKKTENKGSKAAQEEAARRLLISQSSEVDKTVKQMRELSEQAYLKKREPEKLKEMEMQLLDEDLLFADSELTEQEKYEKKLAKDIYRIAKERVSLTDKPVGFQFPESEFNEEGRLDTERKKALLTTRYTEPLEETGENMDQIHWEESQIKMSNLHFGAKDRREMKDEYDLVFEDQIEFINEEILAAESKDDSKKLDLKALKLANIQEVRKHLPIYSYREELIKAVRENQVLIIVGETG
jgi:pre-mRNA-splicing factor ATP-dependent RNA helicase DHX16